jgi:hypothetical protein
MTFCMVCDGNGQIYTQLDITGARSGGPSAGKPCKCSGLNALPKIKNLGCKTCEGSGRIYPTFRTN